MTVKKIFLGSFNNGHKKILQDKAISYLNENKGDKFYYLLPNGDLLKKYRREFIKSAGGTFDLNLFTFDDVVDEIIEESFLNNINYPMKNLIIRNILKDLSMKGLLVYYKDFIDMNGFVESCIDIIREIKRSLITPDIYLYKCPDLPFYKELGLIYKEYENILYDKAHVDRESEYLNSINILNSRSDYLTNLDFVIIDEFYDFRPVEMEIIKSLSNKEIDIFINMPFGKEVNNTILKKSIDRLIGIGFEVEYLYKEPENIFESLGAKLFTINEGKYDYINEIEIVKSPSSYLEIKRIFREIKNKMSEGVPLDDMGVVVLSESYSNNLFKVSREENLPLRINKDTPLNRIPLIKELCNLFNSKITKGSKESIVNRIKSNYFAICSLDIKEEMEYILRRLSFSNLEELNSILEGNKKIGISIDNISNLVEVVEKINLENQGINDFDSVINYNKYFLHLINNFKIDENIWNKYKLLQDYDIFHRDTTALEKLNELFHKMDQIALIEEVMTIEDYYKIFEDYILEENITEVKENFNGLTILTPINARGFTHKYLFIAGLSQEEYPSLKNSSYFLSDDNHRILSSIGIDLKDYYERFANEALKFSTLFASCKEKIYMSFNENSKEEGKNIPSMFLDEVLSRINGEKIGQKVVYTSLELDYLINCDIDKVSCEKDFTNTLLYKYYNSEIDDKYLSLHNKLYGDYLNSINKIIEIDLLRESREFNQYRGLLKDSKIHDAINDDLENKVYSISYLEAYSKCPYFFLLNNYFHVEEMARKVEDFSPIDIGSIYHEVLNNYYNVFKDELFKAKDSFKVNDTSDFIKELTYKYSIMAGYNKDKSKDLLIIENIYLRLLNFIESDIARLKESPENISPWGFEIEFGVDNPLELELDDKRILLRGKIDRIDKNYDKDNYIVIDYKSSTYGKKDLTNIEGGLSLQLPVYIISQNDKKVIAGAYSTISDGEFFTAIGILGEGSFITKRQKGAIDKDKWDMVLNNTKNTIFSIVENINKGNFSVNPLECSPYCPYKDICRYEKVMEVE